MSIVAKWLGMPKRAISTWKPIFEMTQEPGDSLFQTVITVAVGDSTLFGGHDEPRWQLGQVALVFGGNIRRWIERWKYSLPQFRSVPALI
jgi:hypothetical protein